MFVLVWSLSLNIGNMFALAITHCVLIEIVSLVVLDPETSCLLKKCAMQLHFSFVEHQLNFLSVTYIILANFFYAYIDYFSS